MSESKQCVSYHGYTRELAKISNDATVFYGNRILAEHLRNRIEKLHFEKCVKIHLKHYKK